MVNMKLQAYLNEHGLTAKEFALSIDRSPSTIYRLLRSEIKPRWELVEAIYKGTKGAVTPNDFMGDWDEETDISSAG